MIKINIICMILFHLEYSVINLYSIEENKNNIMFVRVECHYHSAVMFLGSQEDSQFCSHDTEKRQSAGRMKV